MYYELIDIIDWHQIKTYIHKLFNNHQFHTTTRRYTTTYTKIHVWH